MKCEKCGIRIKNNDFRFPAINLCFNCASIWQNIHIMVKTMQSYERYNRDIEIALKDIKITKRKKPLKF